MPDRILPPLRRTAADAEAFARVVHAGQVDKAGLPYVEHLERVVGRLDWKLPQYFSLSDPAAFAKTDEVLQVAWLHDVLEDTDHTPDDLANEGFHQNVILDVLSLSRVHRFGESYHDWIASICRSNRLPVLIVKLADMEDNSDPARLALLPEAMRERLERKYREPIAMLCAAVERGAGR